LCGIEVDDLKLMFNIWHVIKVCVFHDMHTKIQQQIFIFENSKVNIIS
jgi:hypothetical protein